MSISLLCVDDNVPLAEALHCLIDTEPDLEWAGHLESTDRLLEEALSLKPDLVLLDLDLPGPPALEVLDRLVEQLPDTRVVILSGYMSEALLDRAADAGAWGYINKNDGPAALLSGIRRVIDDECVFDVLMSPAG